MGPGPFEYFIAIITPLYWGVNPDFANTVSSAFNSISYAWCKRSHAFNFVLSNSNFTGISPPL
jgi:hypothetical protein